MTGIVICADDFGMHPDVDRAIVDLARRKRLSATSVLVDAHGVSNRADWLAGLNIDVGLHLNLSEVVGDLRAQDVESRLGRLIVACYSRTVSTAWLQGAVSRQLDRYENIFGVAPAYVDGHQHVHQLPVVRDVLITELQRRYGQVHAPTGQPWVRSTRMIGGLIRTGARQWLKAKVIETLGAHSLQRLAAQGGFPMNDGFAGVYDFTRPALPYNVLLQHWLKGCVTGSLIMCHPSASVLAGDPIGQARLQEFQVLSSPELGQYLEAQGLSIVRLNQVMDSRSSLP